MPSQTGQQNLLASAANGSNHGCRCGGTWHFGASPAQEAQGEQAGTLARAAAPASRQCGEAASEPCQMAGLTLNSHVPRPRTQHALA